MSSDTPARPRRRALYVEGAAKGRSAHDLVNEASAPGPAHAIPPVHQDDPPRQPARLLRRPSMRFGLWSLLALFLIAALMAPQVAPRWAASWLARQPLNQEAIDEAVLNTLKTKTLPSQGARAFETVAGSVVRVVGMHDEPSKTDPRATKPRGKKGRGGDDAPPPPPSATPKDREVPSELDDERNSVGTGVVIIDNGTILTNLHVVAGARRIKVEFADGLVADADLLGLRPEHDLAVLRARKIPDDLKAATMRSTEDLKPGDNVTAVGFPFGIGPSVSRGVVSGLKRSFRSPDGRTVLSNLIQFDAAANPGNSGGPLVTDDGEVVGIVTAIYNPTQQRFFVGLGFAVPIENAAQAAGMPPF